mgnify:CR=1 FL=1
MKAINTNKSPSAIGPYSQAIQKGNMIFISGQLPIDVTTGQFSGEDIQSQTVQSLENIKNIIEEAGASMADIVKTTILLKDINDFAEVNKIYATYFKAPFPARATYEVSKLPLDALIEIESIVCKE